MVDDPRRADRVGVVAIGRNEGERLRLCLRSVQRQADRIIYVDSGSSDGSVALAKAFGVDVAELDLRQPFTAARARNEGASSLLERFEDLDYIQFVDGDCELETAWIDAATAYLDANPDVVAVCGGLSERNPEASIFNRLCAMEWEGPVGDVTACGGIAMFRAAVFRDSSGFDPSLIAGEEPDLCFRLRQSGWRVVRIDAAMAIHDAAMFHPRQWWQRAKRSGYADMEAFVRRGREEPHLRRRVWSNFLWSLPIGWPFWPLLWLRAFRRRGALFATHIVLGKIPHAIGQLKYHQRERVGGGLSLIKHK